MRTKIKMEKLIKGETPIYWIITTEYPPYHTGGIGTYCYHTARMLRDRGHNVTIFIYDFNLSKDSVTVENGIRIVRFVPTKTKTQSFLGYATNLSYEYAHIIKLFIEKEGRPDIIESQEYSGIAYYLQQFKLLGYKPFSDLTILVTCHAPSFLCLEYNHVPVYQFPDYWIGQMEKSTMRSADILISPSKYFVQQAKQRMPWNDIHENYLMNPVETIETEQPASIDNNYIVCFGKLSPLKGSFRLLEYFKQLWDEGFPHPLNVIGGTEQIFHPERLTMGDSIKQKFGSYIEKGLLKLHGELSPGKAKDVLGRSHVVIVPSLVDNLPYTVLEVMSWGKVVLSSVQGGQSEIITNGENGFLFDHFKQDDFKNKLLHILKLNEEQIQTVGKKAITTICSQCSYSSVYPKKMEIINNFLQFSAHRNNVFPFIHAFKQTATINSNHEKPGLLSVVIPYYNLGVYIEDCVQSVLAADYKDKEIIIIDDGSETDESINVLENIRSKYPVTIYHKKNEGISLARNYGANKASGQYLTFLDADDTVEKSYYSKAVSVLNDYKNVHFVGCWTKYFGRSKKCWPTFNAEPPYLLIHNMVNSSALVYKRNSFLQHGLNDGSFIYGMEDWDSVINMVSNNYGGVVLPELLFNYRVRKNSMARKFTRVKRLYLHSLINKKYRELYKMYAVEIANILQANGSSLNFDNPSLDLPGEFYVSFLPGKWQEKLKRKIKQNKFWRTLAYSVYKKIKK